MTYLPNLGMLVDEARLIEQPQDYIYLSSRVQKGPFLEIRPSPCSSKSDFRPLPAVFRESVKYNDTCDCNTNVIITHKTAVRLVFRLAGASTSFIIAGLQERAAPAWPEPVLPWLKYERSAAECSSTRQQNPHPIATGHPIMFN